ncbi:MAG: hypothetical protein AAF638_02675 [Pseudomonadota bacterium]
MPGLSQRNANGARMPEGEPLPNGAEMIPSPKTLRRAYVPSMDNSKVEAQIARANGAIEDLSSNFGNWIEDEIGKLIAAAADIQTSGYSPARLKTLFIASHELRGNATMFGEPSISQIADTLCSLIDTMQENDAKVPPEALITYVYAIKAVHREKGAANTEMTDELVSMLRKAADKITQSG